MNNLFNIEEELEKYNLTPEMYEKLLQDCSNKVQKISDDDWQEICSRYCLEFNPDTIRKGTQPPLIGSVFVSEYYKWKESKNLHKDDDSYMKELQIQKRELEKERQKLFATKVEYTRSIRQQSRFELFYENIKDAIQTLEVPDFVRRTTIENDKEYVLSIADIHAGSFFDVITNHYSYDECTRRFEYLTNHMIDYIQNNDIERLKVLCLGDDVQGLLRLSDLQLNESTVVQATVYVSKMIARLLNNLSKYVDIDYYHVPSSNHSQTRPIGTKASELASEDVEYIIGNYIKDVLENNNNVNVHLNFGYEYIEIPIFDFKTIAMHGHQLNSVENAIKDISFDNKTFYDYLFIAHFHAGKEVTSGESDNSDIETLICPSFVGTCPYAKKIRKGAKPACKVFVFDKKYGHTDTHKIILN